MTPHDLIANFEVLAEAPGGIARLRELVLQLAVRGRLVKQNADDKAAGELLGSRQVKLLESTPYRLPQGWAWTTISRLGEIRGGGTPSKQNPSFWNGCVPWVTPKDMKRTAIGESIDNITDIAVENAPVKLIPPNSLLMVVRGMILAHSFPTALTTRSVTVNQDMKALVPFDTDVAPYLLLATRGHKAAVLNLVERSTHGTCKLPASALFAMPIGLPPLPEQKRIVARVDKLMGLLDRLEAARNAREATRQALRDAALAALRNADTPEEVEVAWNRIASRMDDLFTNPGDVEPLRFAILQLAFRGRLVRQDPNERPASSLLKPITESELQTRNANSTDKIDTAVLEREEMGPHELRSGWMWTRFGTITDSRLGKMLDKAKNSGPLRPYLRNANLQWFRFNLEDVKQMRLEESELDECSLAIGDLVICEGGEPGRAAVCDHSVAGMVYQKALHRARPRSGISPWYLAYLLRCDSWSGRLAELFTGATIKHLTGKALNQYLVPLPPLAEQHRIVARIETLMGLVDQLEHHLVIGETTHDAFAAAAAHQVDA